MTSNEQPLSSQTGRAARSMGTRQHPPIDVVGCPLGGAIHVWGKRERAVPSLPNPIGRPFAHNQSHQYSGTCEPEDDREDREKHGANPIQWRAALDTTTSDAEAPVRSPSAFVRHVRDVVPNEKTCPSAVGMPADLSSTVGLGDDMKAGQLIAKAAFDPAQLNAIKKAFEAPVRSPFGGMLATRRQPIADCNGQAYAPSPQSA